MSVEHEPKTERKGVKQARLGSGSFISEQGKSYANMCWTRTQENCETAEPVLA